MHNEIQHIDDGRVRVYDTRTGEKTRVMPNLLQFHPHYKLTPMQRRKMEKADKNVGSTLPEKEKQDG